MKQQASNNQKALKSGIWYTITNFFSKSLVFLTTPIFTRLLSTGEIGNFSNFTSILAIFSAIASLQLFTSVALARFDYKDNLDDYISSNLIFATIFSAVLYGAFFIFRNQFSDFVGINEVEFHILFAYLLVYPATEMMQIKCRIKYKYVGSIIITVASVVTSTLISVLMAFLLEDKLLGRVLGYYIPLIVVNIVIYIVHISKTKKLSFEYVKYGLRYSLPMIIHVLSSELLSSSDKIMITQMCGEEQNGLYSVVYTSAVVISVLWTSMNTAWSPWVFEKINNGEEKLIKKVSYFYILFYAFVVFSYLLVAPEVLYIMGGKDYMRAVSLLPPVIVSYMFLFVYSLYVGIESYYKKQKYIAISTLIAAVLNILLNFLLIPVFGYEVAAYTTLAGYVVMFVLHFIFVKIMKKDSIYSTKYNWIIVSFFLLLMVGMVFLYKVPIVRYVLIGVVVLSVITFVIIFRKEIYYMLKNKSLELFKLRIMRIIKKEQL